MTSSELSQNCFNFLFLASGDLVALCFFFSPAKRHFRQEKQGGPLSRSMGEAWALGGISEIACVSLSAISPLRGC